MALLELSVNPIGTEKSSVAKYVARAIEVIQKEKSIKHTTTPMGTILEGELNQLLAIIPKMHEAVFKAGVDRIVTVIKIDDRRDIPTTMDGKMASLRRELKRQV